MRHSSNKPFPAPQSRLRKPGAKNALLASVVLLGVISLSACESEDESFDTDASSTSEQSSSTSTQNEQEERLEPDQEPNEQTGGSEISASQEDSEKSSESPKGEKKRVTPEELNSEN
nr:hypothetical protein [uncultured Halomonas sp.]